MTWNKPLPIGVQSQWGYPSEIGIGPLQTVVDRLRAISSQYSSSKKRSIGIALRWIIVAVTVHAQNQSEVTELYQVVGHALGRPARRFLTEYSVNIQCEHSTTAHENCDLHYLLWAYMLSSNVNWNSMITMTNMVWIDETWRRSSARLHHDDYCGASVLRRVLDQWDNHVGPGQCMYSIFIKWLEALESPHGVRQGRMMVECGRS